MLWAPAYVISSALWFTKVCFYNICQYALDATTICIGLVEIFKSSIGSKINNLFG